MEDFYSEFINETTFSKFMYASYVFHSREYFTLIVLQWGDLSRILEFLLHHWK